MAKRLGDTEDRPSPHRHPEVEAAEFEAEQPARELSGLPKLVISAAAVAVSLYALYWVVRPQPAPALPDLVPGRHPGHDPARLPAPDQPGRNGRRRRA